MHYAAHILAASLPSLDQAYHPADPRSGPPPFQGTLAFRKWARLEGRNQRPPLDKESSKYLGPTMMTFRVLVQNRRPDGRVVVVKPEMSWLIAREEVKLNLLPSDRWTGATPPAGS
jgi:hypothetical protein